MVLTKPVRIDSILCSKQNDMTYTCNVYLQNKSIDTYRDLNGISIRAPSIFSLEKEKLIINFPKSVLCFIELLRSYKGLVVPN